MKRILIVAALASSFATLLLAQSREVKHNAKLEGSQKTRILDQVIDQKFSGSGSLSVKDADAVLLVKSNGREVRIPGIVKNDKIYLVHTSFTGDGITTVHYIGSKQENGAYKGTVASLIDTRDYVNLGTFTLTLSAP